MLPMPRIHRAVSCWPLSTGREIHNHLPDISADQVHKLLFRLKQRGLVKHAGQRKEAHSGKVVFLWVAG